MSTKPNENQGDTEDESSESVREREGESDGSELGRRQPYLIDGELLGGLEVCARQIEAAVDNGEDGVSRQKLRQPLIPRMGIYYTHTGYAAIDTDYEPMIDATDFPPHS